MDKAAPVGRGFPPSSSSSNLPCDKHPGCKSPNSGAVLQPSALQPVVLKLSSSNTLCVQLVFATTLFNLICASPQPIANFSVQSTKYDCSDSGNMICLADTFVYDGDNNSNSASGIEAGRLSLIHRFPWRTGAAFYSKPVQLLDRSTGQTASFSTFFTMDMRFGAMPGVYTVGEGMTFLMTANNSYHGGMGQYLDLSHYHGSAGKFLGVFDNSNYTSFKCIVVEFDTTQDPDTPILDISANHVSFDFSNITAAAAANSSVHLADNVTKYVWVDYSNVTRQLEVRISNETSRPIDPLLNYTVNLSDVVEELMWVGFSSSSGGAFSNFYIGNWTFESYGLATARREEAPAQLKIGIIVGTIVGILAMLLGCTVYWVVQGKLPCSRFQLLWALRSEEDHIITLEGMPKRFCYKELSMATKAFSQESKLGEGGFGSVYRGVLTSFDSPVAVKKIDGESKQGEKEFMAEISVISQLRHRNLIQLVGWCKDTAGGNYLLVYELMANSSLDKKLFNRANSQVTCLSWPQRFNIVTGTASALDYLHHGWKQKVLHRDVKSSNIMLDKDWNAKLGDFGLARLVDHHREAATTQPAGTLGYIAPEVFPSCKFTDKSDVFAFGAVVLEVACGRKALSFHLPEDERVLVDWVWQKLSKNELMSTVDKRLKEYDASRMEVMLKVGLLCSHPDPSARPSMRRVVQMLAGDVPVPLLPPSKPYPLFSSSVPSEIDNVYNTIC